MTAWMSRIDAYAAVAGLANVVLAALDAVVSIYEKWVAKHRPLILIAFVACGCVGALAAVKSAAKSAHDVQESNAKINDAVDRAKKEFMATLNGGDSFCYAIPGPRLPPNPGKMNLMIIHQDI